jgi:hypothetical protein
MIYFAWPSGAGGDFLITLGSILKGKVNSITFDKRNFQFYHSQDISCRYNDIYIDQKENPTKFVVNKYVLGHDNFGVEYPVDWSLFDKVVHVRAEDYYTLSYIAALYWTKVIAYDAIKNGWEENPFDFRHSLQENWSVKEMHPNVININYAALFYDTDNSAVERLYEALDMPLNEVELEVACKCLKVYKDANDHHLCQKPYNSELEQELITLENDNPLLLLWEFCEKVKEWYEEIDINEPRTEIHIENE